MESTTTLDWQHITTALQAPFDPQQVEWRPQGKTNPGARVQLIAYITSAAVQARLDEVAPGWSFTWEPLVIADGEVRVAKGALTIYGVPREDIGTASNWEPSKGCATDALKRCACLWGIGRYLRSLPDVWVNLDNQGHISEQTLAKLRDGLSRRAGAA